MEELLILKTETLLVPTQLICIDLTQKRSESDFTQKRRKKEDPTSGGKVKAIVDDFQEDDRSIDYISLADLCLDIWKAKQENELKEIYIQKIRPQLMKEISELYQRKIQEDFTKGRLVFFFIGDTSEWSSLFLLKELPTDISNFCYLKTGGYPGVFRFMFEDSSSKETSASSPLLEMQEFCEEYYFSFCKTYKANPFDALLYFSSFSLLQKLLEDIFPLHIQEYQFAKDNHDFNPNSGAYLFFESFAGQKFLYSGLNICPSKRQYPWKKIDWLSAANFYFFPRIWNIINSHDREKLFSKFDYENADFRKGITETGTAFPASLCKTLALSIRDENEDVTLGNIKLKKKKASERQTVYNYFLGETVLDQQNFQLRYSAHDFAVLSEILTYFQREKQTQQLNFFLDQIWEQKAKAERTDTKPSKRQNKNLPSSSHCDRFTHFPLSLFKQRGNILATQPDRAEEAAQAWKAYRMGLEEKNANFKAVPQNPYKFLSFAKDLYEVANAALQQKDFQAASDYALEYLRIYPENSNAAKVLMWASKFGGITSKEKEEVLFRLFVSTLKNIKAIEEYYGYVIQKYPDRYEYHFFCAIFYSSVKKDLPRAISLLKKTHEIQPDDSQTLGFLATCMQINEQTKENRQEIRAYYEKSLQLDPDNAVNITNYCGFLLVNFHESKTDVEIACKKLDKLLYSEDFISQEPSVAVECWFLVLIFYPTFKMEEALENLKMALHKGGRSPSWDFSPHLQFAKTRSEKGELVFPLRHRSMISFELVFYLSKVISGKKPLSELEQFEAWNEIPLEDDCTPHPEMKKSLFDDIFSGYSQNEYLEEDFMGAASKKRKGEVPNRNPTNQQQQPNKNLTKIGAIKTPTKEKKSSPTGTQNKLSTISDQNSKPPTISDKNSKSSTRSSTNSKPSTISDKNSKPSTRSSTNSKSSTKSSTNSKPSTISDKNSKSSTRSRTNSKSSAISESDNNSKSSSQPLKKTSNNLSNEQYTPAKNQSVKKGKSSSLSHPVFEPLLNNSPNAKNLSKSFVPTSFSPTSSPIITIKKRLPLKQKVNQMANPFLYEEEDF